MTNAELIKALRHCGKGGDIAERCLPCGYYDGEPWCEAALVNDAADALEAADEKIADCVAAIEALDDSNDAYIKENERLKKRIAELEAQMPKEGVLEAKKPKTVKETGYSFYCDCPTCGGRLISNVDGEWCAGSFDRFCRMCGQKIDWSEYCGWSNLPRGAKMKGEQE